VAESGGTAYQGATLRQPARHARGPPPPRRHGPATGLSRDPLPGPPPSPSPMPIARQPIGSRSTTGAEPWCRRIAPPPLYAPMDPRTGRGAWRALSYVSPTPHHPATCPRPWVIELGRQPPPTPGILDLISDLIGGRWGGAECLPPSIRLGAPRADGASEQPPRSGLVGQLIANGGTRRRQAGMPRAWLTTSPQRRSGGLAAGNFASISRDARYRKGWHACQSLREGLHGGRRRKSLEGGKQRGEYAPAAVAVYGD